tara:strand:- start:1016 stop:1735 length:720 start_codon:yes stop_codon:yes gene_type:complete
MFKKSLLAVALVFAASSANAAYTTTAQTSSYDGAAGSKSTEEGVSAFSFSKFDTSLGVLTGVKFTYDFSILGGYIGATNQSTQVVSGDAELGSSVSFDFSDVSEYLNISSSSLTQDQLFTLQPTGAADDADKFRLDGASLNTSKSKTVTESFILDQFVDGGLFTVDFLTSSITDITTNGAGVQGIFEAVDISLAMSVSYIYEDFPEPEEPSNVENVPVPLIGAAGLVMFGLAGMRRKSK